MRYYLGYRCLLYTSVLTIEEQQLIFKRLSEEKYREFRQRQLWLFGKILETFGIKADENKIGLFTNLSLSMMVMRRALPDTLPLLCLLYTSRCV